MGERVEIPGGEAPVGAFVSQPALRGVVVLHEWWGLFSGKSNATAICDRLCAEGMLAIAVDLYGGRSAATEDQAERLMRSLDDGDPLPAIAAGVAEARRRGAGKVAVLGFCMGGALALRAGRALRDLDAVVTFYGLGDDGGAPLRVPAQGHFALRDGYLDPARARALAGVELHFYDAGHAFMNDRLPGAFDEGCAALAWERTLEFLRSR